MNMDGYLFVAWGLLRGAQQNARADQLKPPGMPYLACVCAFVDSLRRQQSAVTHGLILLFLCMQLCSTVYR